MAAVEFLLNTSSDQPMKKAHLGCAASRLGAGSTSHSPMAMGLLPAVFTIALYLAEV
jgi:hypothetical protein